MSPSQVTFFFSSSACTSPVMVLWRWGKKKKKTYSFTQIVLKGTSLRVWMVLVIGEVMMHPSVYFSLPDSLIGLFVIMSSPNSYLSEFISGIHFHFHTQAPSFYSHPHLALRKSNKKKVNSKKCMWVFFLFVCFLRFPRLLLSLFHTCSWEHTLHHWSGFVLSVVLLEFIEK